MAQLTLFDEPVERPPTAAGLAPRLASLAERGVRIGTSSWKYPGWVGTIYDGRRYEVRGAFSSRKFEADCLAEYAGTFPVVGADFTFYRFPDRNTWARLFGETPGSLMVAPKVPEELTVPIWPAHARYGSRGGSVNERFLNPELFVKLFENLLMPHRERVAALIFEFGAFSRRAFAAPGAFLERLDGFLGRLPGGLRYAVEVRNPELLGPEYFGVLEAHGVAHVFNAWTRMPELAEQVARPGAFTAGFTVARALLRRGRPYEEAVRMFEPYERVQQPDPEGRGALRDLVIDGLRRRRPTFLLVNNRYEGHAPGTIEAVLDGVQRAEAT